MSSVWTRRIGFAGIGIAALGVWLMLPPVGDALRDATGIYEVIPVVLGIFAIAAGISAVSRGERKVGWVAIACGVIGIALGLAAAQGSMADHEAVFVWSSLFAATLRWATPLIFAAIGGMFSERSGVANIALEGMMLAGAFFGIWGAVRFDHWAIGLLTAMVAGGALAFAAVSSLPPLYTGEARVLVGLQGPRVLNIVAVIADISADA